MHTFIPGTSRRRFVQLAVAAGAVAGFGLTTTAQNQGTAIELGGESDGWIGRSPEDISGQTNPTLQLQAGETYSLTWENVDGKPHNFVIVSDQGEDVVSSAVISEEGQTQTVEFDATEGMSEYYCSIHPEDMRGSIELAGGDGSTATDQNQVTLSRVFSAGRMTGDQQPEPVDTMGEGAAVFGLDEEETSLHYVLLATNMTDVTMAHIHLAPEGENGDVAAWLFGAPDESSGFSAPVEGGVVADGVLAHGMITDADLVGPLAGSTLQDLVMEMESGGAYVNVHTVTNPSGEIRGQLEEVDEENVMLSQQTDITASAGEALTVDTRGTISVGGEMGDGTETGTGTETETDTERSGSITITYEGTVAPGNTVTLTATVDGEPVTGADVYVENGDGDEQLVGTTDSNGQIDVTVPAEGDKAGRLRAKVRHGEMEGELEVGHGDDDGDDDR